MVFPFDNPFNFSKTKDSKIIIRRSGKTIKILGVSQSGKFLERISGKSEEAIQIELARVTGNYKRGNERKNI